MLISAPTEEDVPGNLSDRLRTLPALIDVYVLLVDQVLRRHGFDPETREFVLEQTVPAMECFKEDSTQISGNGWTNGPHIDSITARFEPGRRRDSELKARSCEADMLLAAC